jgi:anti-anti-sigma regulatory factor
MSVWVGDKIVCFKIGGRANFTASGDFKAVVQSLRQKGHLAFVLDLTDCVLMDSTFLGVLSGLGLQFSNPANGNVPASMELLNPNARISDLLENLGIVHLFKIAQGPPMSVERLACIENTHVEMDRREISRLCLEAHQTLMEINPANVPKFKDVTQFLAEDLKRIEGQREKK